MPKKKDEEGEIPSKAEKEAKERAARANGFKEGRDAGFTKGRELGFREGVYHIVTVAEEEMADELGFASREKLVASRKLPSYWVSALMKCFGDEAARPPADVRILQEDKDHG